MRSTVVPGVLSAALSLLALGLAADAGSPGVEPRQQPTATVVTVLQASVPEPVRQAKSACKLVVGWPGCRPKPEPKPEPQPQQQAPAAVPPPQAPAAVEAPACDQACQVERAANTPAERPAPQPDPPEFPDDEGTDLGTVTPPAG